MKDNTEIFPIGVAVSKKPEGPFVPEPAPITGKYSIDPCVFPDDHRNYYMYFGGFWGGQLQRYRNNKAQEYGVKPADDEPALCAKVVRMSYDMLEFVEEPGEFVVNDEKEFLYWQVIMNAGFLKLPGSI